MQRAGSVGATEFATTAGRLRNQLDNLTNRAYPHFEAEPFGAGADKNHARTNGATPLHVAAANGHAAAVSVLLDAGADKTRKFCGDTALDLAKTGQLKVLLR